MEQAQESKKTAQFREAVHEKLHHSEYLTLWETPHSLKKVKGFGAAFGRHVSHVRTNGGHKTSSIMPLWTAVCHDRWGFRSFASAPNRNAALQHEN